MIQLTTSSGRCALKWGCRSPFHEIDHAEFAEGQVAAGEEMAVAHERVALADLLDVVGHLAGTEGHGRRHLGRVMDVGAELVRPAERGMLLGDVAP